MTWTKKQLSTLLVVSVTSFMGTFLISSINIALPAIEKDFQLDAIALSWVVTAFILANAMLLLPVGKWGDAVGNTKLYKVGLGVFTAASLLCALAPDATWLIAVRFLQGIGSAFSNTTGQAILVSGFSQKNRGQVIGISVASVYSGLALGPLIGGMLTHYAGWHSLFWIAAVLGVASIVIALLFLKEKEVSLKKTAHPHLRGTILFMAGLTTLVYGSSCIPSVIGWGLMVLGLLLLILFWIGETRSENPILDTKLFTENKLFRYSNMAALINYTATFAIVFYLSLYLQKIEGLTPQKAGAVIIAQPIMMAVFSPIVGKLSDKIQPRHLATGGMAMCCAGLGALALIAPQTPLWVITVILVWMGLGFAFFSSPNMNTIMSSVDKSRYGQASGISASMRVFGQIVSMTIVTFFFAALFHGKAIDSIDNVVFLKAMQWGFTTFALINLLGIYFSFARGDVKRQET